MGASAKTKQSQTSTYTPTAQASGLYTDIINQAQAAQSGYNPATASTVAGFTDPQTQAFAQIAGNQNIWQPGVQAGADMVNQAGQGIGAADISKFYNPYQQDVINTTLDDIDQRDAMQTRGFMSNEAAQGGLGGNGIFVGRAQLQGQQGQNRNATVANLRNTGWQQALGAAQADKTRGLQAGTASAGIGQLMSQLGYTDAGQMLAAGNQQQAQQQNVNDTASKNALNEQLWPMQQAQWLAGIGSGIGPLTGGTTTGSGTATTSQGKGAGQVLGAGLTLASMASDERVKEDVSEVGKTHDGQPIYSFRYKGDPRTQMGLMAQDVERGNHPEAVTEGIGGMKMVNYDTALRDAKADGGLVMPEGLMGWSQIQPASLKIPELSKMDAPAVQQDDSDMQGMADMGKKAGSGLESLFGKLGGSTMPAASSPAGGAMAASGLQGLGGAGGGAGGLAGLASLFGFADGGAVDEFSFIDQLGDDTLMGGDQYDDLAREMGPDIERVESGGRDIQGPMTYLGERAQGPRQIMPSTARDPGFGVKPLRPGASVEEQREFSDAYTAAMLRRYKGDKEAAAIAYNGGPKRADNWLAAGRDDSVIPAESAAYYKKVLGNQVGGQVEALHVKATAPAANNVGMGEPYTSKGDRATGGLLKRTFGLDFNPLNLSEPERKAMLVAGLSMMSHGNIGKGGLAGMSYLSGVEAGDRERSTAASKLAYDMQKDAADLALRTRAEDRQGARDTADQKWREGETGRKNSELTGDQKEYDAAKREGYTGTFTEFQKAQRAAGATGSNASLPAEVGARIGLGRVFTGMIDDIEKRIGKLGVSGRADLAAGRGDAAALWRDIETGREALVRGLTGAGMSQTEAMNAASRYQISADDKDETMISKVRSLKRDLEAVESGAITGKSGSMAKDYDKPTPVKTQVIRPRAKDAKGNVVEWDGSTWAPVQ